MFSRIFNPESALWQGVARFGDLIWLNILFLLSCVPLVTIGAATTALFDVSWRLLDERGSGATSVYVSSFRTNFGQSTVIWLIVGPVGAGLLSLWVFLPLPELSVMKTLLSLLYLLFFPFFFFLQARFANSVWHTMKNAVLIALSRLPYAVGVLAVNVAMIALAFAVGWYAPAWLPPLLLGGFAMVIYATIPLLNGAVKPWLG